MRFVSLIVALVAMAGAAAAQTHAFGPAVGAKLPPITAADQSGRARDLASLGGKQGLVLLVTRSADWCPYCQVQLIGLEGVREQIDQRGWKLAAITTDTVPELARFTERRGIGFPILSDEPASVVRALNLLDPTQPPGARHNGLPVPTLFFVSPKGVVRAKLGDANYRVRPAPEVVLQTLNTLK